MRKMLALGLLVGFVGGVSLHSEPATNEKATPSSAHLTRFNQTTIDHHAQKFDNSCIPSAVEMVLKLLERVPGDYYDQQNAWQNKIDGTFGNFDNKTISGVTFHRKFFLPRDDQFPLPDLFKTIDEELRAGRYVIVSLPSNMGYHMYVIYDEDAAGDFLAVSKFGTETTQAEHVKAIIKKMKGTDIMTYEVGK